MSVPSILIVLFIMSLMAFTAFQQGGAYSIESNDMLRSSILVERSTALWAMSSCTEGDTTTVAQLGLDGLLDASKISNPTSFSMRVAKNGRGIVSVSGDAAVRAAILQHFNGVVVGSTVSFSARKTHFSDGSSFARNIKSQTNFRCGY